MGGISPLRHKNPYKLRFGTTQDDRVESEGKGDEMEGGGGGGSEGRE